MPQRSILLALSICSVTLSAQLNADSPWDVRSDYSIPLSADAHQRLTTEYYQLGQWNVITAQNDQYHEPYFYPTPDDLNPAGVHSMDAHKIGLGDFNGDGRQDVIISWATFPHVIERPPIAPTILLNDEGELRSDESIWATAPPARMFAYKAGIADFNLDGRDDAVLGAFGVLKRLADGSYENIWERIPLMVSEEAGLADFSDRIAGQEADVLETFSFAHDMAVGDVNGDGIFDFYQGRHLFIGDGSGGFKVRNDLIPPEAGPDLHYVMSSAIGDLDNDGVDDLVIALADGQPEESAVSGWIFLSDGKPDLASARLVALPPGRFGLNNTKHNSLTLADLDSDGRLDIIIGQTRAVPYYQGRELQLLMNRGNGNFVEETGLRLSEAIRPDAQGEGIAIVMDINGDGYPDIVDSAGGQPDDVAIMVNDGQGLFNRLPMSLLPIVQNYHLAGNENWEGESYGNSRTGYIYPIDLDGNGTASFLLQMFLNADNWPPQPGDFSRSVLYTVSPVTPFEPVSGPPRPGDFECLLEWGEKSAPDILADEGVETQRLDAFEYRHYPSTDTYLGLLANRVLLYQPSINPNVIDLGGLQQFLPMARSSGC